MKARLLFRDRDFDWKWAMEAAIAQAVASRGQRHQRSEGFDPGAGLPWNAEALTADLGLETLFQAMAGKDDHVYATVRKVILAATRGAVDGVRYRQDILKDFLSNRRVLAELYAMTVELIEKSRGHFLGSLTRYPDSVLRDAIERMTIYLEFLKRLRSIADREADKFQSAGCSAFFAMIKRDIDDPYLALIKEHLQDLTFRRGELMSAKLGRADKGEGYILHRTPVRKWSLRTLWDNVFGEKGPVYRFELQPRDEAGARALGELRNRGISVAANALGQSADHVRDFFAALRIELAFYVGCVNLAETLEKRDEPICFPVPREADDESLSLADLYDVGLALTIERRVVGNDADADGKRLIVITGPNTGGKSTFLRAIGLAQLMMQSGMFVPARRYECSVCDGVLTHYKREEDSGMESGKFDEEVGRMSEIVDHVAPRAMLLSNESLSSTNEREGSEIARMVFSTLLGEKVRIICVTHMYDLAQSLYLANRDDALFLRASRAEDGSRSFKLYEGQPLPTSFGGDLYEEIFAA